jgi:hypothetical protein
MKAELEEGAAQAIDEKIIKGLSQSRDHKKAAKTSSRFRHYLR